MTRVLALSDEVTESLYGPQLGALRPDLVVACGDLPFDFLEYIVTIANVPLVFVPGNHDPDLSRQAHRMSSAGLLAPFLPSSMEEAPGPLGCVNADGVVVDAAGLRLAGLGGSIRYSRGDNQYTEAQMRRRVRALGWSCRRRRLRDRRGVDLLITHSPPAGVGDGTDPAHRGFESFHRLIGDIAPRILVHGHVHPYGRQSPDCRVESTDVVNAVALRCLEV